MTLRWEHPTSAAEWNDRLLAAPGAASMFQTYQFAEAKRLSGWTPRFAVVGDLAITVHTRRAPGFGTVWYLPKGPGVATVDQLAAVLPDIVAAAKEDGALLVKVEPELRETPENLAGLRGLGLLPAGRIQTNVSTVLVDISGSADELMARFPSKTRNTIRRGAKEGVVVEAAPPGPATYDRMWDLWMEVVADQGITAREKEYQVNMWRTFCESGLGQIFLATHDGRDVAGAFVTVVGDVACYRDGASVRQRPVRGASHVLQWEAMQWAQSRGASTYDMAGTPHSTKVDDESDPYYGIGVFKRSFSKEVTDFVGTYDVPVRPRRYALWQRVGHRAVAKLLSRRRGATFY
jgi:lipid II:glycine glycyltransferase (peptidoglycan interpeptide bridge formation enzyme)